MKVLKVGAILILVYLAIIVAFESMIGFFQPRSGAVLVITTLDSDGSSHDRVVSRLASDGKLYVAANHWPRAGYERALANPEVQAEFDGQRAAYTAVPVSGAEHERVDADNRLPVVFRILTGFPPRYFLRLDPKPQ
jgi:hypothetical protein